MIDNFMKGLPDLRFSDLGFITRLFDRLTRNDLRLTSLRNVQARSCIRPIGLFVGVTQYCVANIVFLLFLTRGEN